MCPVLAIAGVGPERATSLIGETWEKVGFMKRISTTVCEESATEI